jgi:putative flippase GtrA
MRTFARYLGVQVLAYAIDMGGFLLVVWLGGGPLFANVLAKLGAGGFAFLAHRRLTFGLRGEPGAGGQLLRYAVLLALNVPLATGILALLLPWFANAALAKFVADVVCVGLTFLLSSRLVFRRMPAGDRAA